VSESCDVAIIGAGVIGAAVAFELPKRGYKTINFDMLPEAGYGSTSNSCAIIRVHYSTLDGTALAYAGYFHWKNWREYLDCGDEAGFAKFHETGCLIMKTKGNGNLKNVLIHVVALGIPYEHWNEERILEALPNYDLRCFSPPKLLNDEGFGEPTGGEIIGGVFFPTAGYISDPKLSAHNLQRAAETKGAQFIFKKRVVEIPMERSRVQGLVLDDGTCFNAPVVVNVAGPHSYKVNALAGADRDMQITTRAVRQEVVHLPSPPDFNFGENGIVVSDNDIGIYCRPEIGNNVLAGSEDPECDPRETVDPDNFDHNFTDQWTTQALRIAQRMPSMGIPSRMAGVVDLYDVTDDWIPIYDKSCVDGFYMACGSSGNQYKNAPIVGKLMASLIDYCENGNDHDTNPLQFPLEYVDHVFDAATVSRLRKVNPDSSFSVLG